MALPSMPDIAAYSNKNRKVPGGVQVKEEKPEDAEISALAAKMVEANKAKMAVAGAGVGVQRGQGTGILPFINRRPGAPGLAAQSASAGSTPSTDNTSNQTSQEKPPFDLTSQKGWFGWCQMGEKHIPYIYRGEDKYCAVRMVENKLLVKYLSCLNSDIYNCTCIRSYYITEHEAKLLTEINGKHCEGRFGGGAFTPRDLVVRLKDADEFYAFLEFCYGKLTNPLSATTPTTNGTESTPTQRCGFIRINSESVVPYALTQGKQFVPLFYFDGETETLKDKAVSLEGWDLAYLKFCCKVQGIRSELFESDTCVCISLDHIKNYFASGTVFEEYWPPKLVESSLLVGGNQRTERGRAYASWTKAPPPQPSPPAAPPATPVVPPKETNGWPHPPSHPSNALPSRFYRPAALPPPSIRNNSVNQLNHIVSNSNLQHRYGAPRLQQSMANSHYYPAPITSTPSHTNQSGVAPPPALVRVTAPPATHLSQTTNYSTSNIVMQQNSSIGMMPGMMPPPSAISSYSNSTNNNNNSTHKAYAPPPLIPVNGTTPRYYGSGVSAGSGGGSDVIDLSSPPQSPQRAALMPNGTSKQLQPQANHSSILQQQPRSKRLIQIKETTSKQLYSHYPFKMQKALVSGKMVPCINAKAYNYSDLLMTVNDLLEHFFPQVPVSKCREVLQDVLNVELYDGNTQQKTVLRENNKVKSLNEEIPLIQLKDVITYMPQLTYVMGRMSPSSLSQDESQAKRQRVS